VILAFEFPSFSQLVEWPDFLFVDTPFGLNKIGLSAILATVITLTLFLLAARQRQMVPTGVQNVAEASIDLIENEIVEPTLGADGKGHGFYVPFLTSMFFFILFLNLFELMPGWLMPGTARMAIPAFLAVLAWVVFNVAGIRAQGAGYFKEVLFPPGVPKPIYILVTPIEFISVFLVRPFSLAVRLYANLLAGHILVVTFAVLTAALWAQQWYAIFLPFPFLMLVFVFVFELLVSVLQAYIFTILTAVYIGGAMHPEH
jgi:F-type H+-transporting ATPase subunit a